MKSIEWCSTYYFLRNRTITGFNKLNGKYPFLLLLHSDVIVHFDKTQDLTPDPSGDQTCCDLFGNQRAEVNDKCFILLKKVV